ncbi:MAG TPA: hypothetical protein DE179_09180 [Oceanospirillaceae bacterium]|nr:hypothetical protein [Oceanospirillaceae bacterium]
MTVESLSLSGPMPAFGLDAEGRVLVCNAAWVDLTKQPEAYWLHKSWQHIQTCQSKIPWSQVLAEQTQGQVVYLQLPHDKTLTCLLSLYAVEPQGSLCFVVYGQSMGNAVHNYEQAAFRAYEQGLNSAQEDFSHRLGNAFTDVNKQTDTIAKQVKVLRSMAKGLASSSDLLAPPLDDKQMVKLQFVINRASQILTTAANDGIVEPLKSIRHQVAQVQSEVRARPIKENPHLAMPSFELGSLLQDSIDYLAHPQVAINVTCEPGLQVSGVSRNLLMQVLLNLLRNSVEAMATIDNASQIHIQGADPGEHSGGPICVCISDTGPGIEEDKVHLLTQAGYSTKAEHTGNGLHWVANFILSIGGQLQFGRDEQLGGARVSVYLP